MPSQRAGLTVPSFGTTRSGPPAIAGATHTNAAAHATTRARRSTLTIGHAPVLGPVAFDSAVQELPESLVVDRPPPRVEHRPLVGAEQGTIDRHAREQSRVVVRIQRMPAADAYLA